jgi:hypothetical protein
MQSPQARLSLLLLLVPILILSGGKSQRTDLPSDAYIWQRRWTPSLTQAIAGAAPLIRDWRVLITEVDRRGKWSDAAVDWQALAQSGRPSVLVIRIDGQIASLDGRTLLDELLARIDDARRSDRAIAGIEVDHDCATARLGEYARFLATLRARLPRSLSIAITALPTWLDSPLLEPVIAQADEIELQVHAVENPHMGLFDRQQALAWIERFARRSGRPFRIALPTYGSRVSWRADGSLVGIESETPLLAGGDEAEELMASPSEVAGLVRDMRENPPSNLRGIAWFRLPTSEDRRGWSTATWRAVMRGRPVQGRLEARVRASGRAGINLLLLENTGDIDLELPRRVEMPSACTIGDGANGYAALADASNLTLQRQGSAALRGHQEQIFGWMRCQPEAGEIDVQP